MRKFDPNIKVDADVAAPIGYLDLAIGKFIGDSKTTMIRANADSVLSMYYADSLISPPALDLVSFGRISRSFQFVNQSGISIDLSAAGYKTTIPFGIPLETEGDVMNGSIDSVLVTEGDIIISTPDIPYKGQTVNVVLPGITEGSGQPGGTLDQGSTEINESLNGAMIRTDKGENVLAGNLIISIPPQNTVVEPGGILADLNLQLTIRQWRMIYGYPGNLSFDLPEQSLQITYSDDLPDGEYYFSNPKITLRTNNSFGIPTGLGFKAFSAYTKTDGEMELTGEGMPSIPDYFYPASAVTAVPLTGGNDHKIVDGRNSNLDEIISSTVTSIKYLPAIQFKPPEGSVHPFIDAESRLGLDVILELPLSGYAGYIYMRDTTDFKPDRFTISDNGDVGAIIFNLYYENSFPADMEVQLYLADADMNITDTVFEKPVSISGAPPVETWQQDPPKSKGSVNAGISTRLAHKIKSTRYLIAEGKLNTTGMKREVKIFNNQSLLLKAGIIINFDTNTNKL
ncbi:MAG TPA: hypothetical protein VE870_12550 [Bacteroidales bacterium]|nr:hypothetical protein [Bacteroidales bacterium]